MKSIVASEYVREDRVAQNLFPLGERGQSIVWRARAVNSNSSGLYILAKSPEFASLRADLRVQALPAKAGVK